LDTRAKGLTDATPALKIALASTAAAAADEEEDDEDMSIMGG
jgi:hypothetical protein